MSYKQPNHIKLLGTECEYQMQRRPWWLQVIFQLISFGFAGLVTVMAYSVVLETSGVLPIAATVIMGILAVLMIFGIQVEYIKIGDWIDIGIKTPTRDRDGVRIDVEDTREEPKNGHK